MDNMPRHRRRQENRSWSLGWMEDRILTASCSAAMTALVLRDSSAAIHIIFAVVCLMSAVAFWVYGDVVQLWLDRTPEFASSHQGDLEATPAERWRLPTSCPGWPRLPKRSSLAEAVNQRTGKGTDEEVIEVALDPRTLAPISAARSGELHVD